MVAGRDFSNSEIVENRNIAEMSSPRPSDHRRKWDKVEYQRRAQDRKFSLINQFDRRYNGKNRGISIPYIHIYIYIFNFDTYIYMYM